MPLPAGSYGKAITADGAPRGWLLPLALGLSIGAMIGALFVIACRPKQAQQLLPPPRYP